MTGSLFQLVDHYDCIVQFSGGKDSLAALHLAMKKWSVTRIIVFYGDTGGFYPHMVKFVHDTCEKWNLPLRVTKPSFSLEAYHAMAGYPSDILPIEASIDMQPYNKNHGPVLQSPIRCCSVMQWQTLHKAVVESGIKNVIRGSKKCDQHVGMVDGYRDANGIVYHCPLWDWTDDDVFSYLEANHIQAAEHYKEVNNSFDCVLCTAFLRSDGAKARIEYTKKHYPEYMHELRNRMQVVRSIIETEHAEVMKVMDAANS